MLTDETYDRDAARRPRGRVLLAEDDVDMRALVAARLRHDGYEVAEVGSGDEVVAFVETEVADFDLLLLDVCMPGTSGLEIVYLMRALHRSTPVLLMTGFPHPEMLDETDRLGVTVIHKPFPFERLSHAAIAAIAAGPAPHKAVGP